MDSSALGKLFICPDVSGSMQSPVTGYRSGGTTEVRCVDVAGVRTLLKGSRTPEEAGMKLRKKPLVPKSLSVTPPFRIRVSDVPTSWLPYCSTIESETA